MPIAVGSACVVGGLNSNREVLACLDEHFLSHVVQETAVNAKQGNNLASIAGHVPESNDSPVQDSEQAVPVLSRIKQASNRSAMKATDR